MNTTTRIQIRFYEPGEPALIPVRMVAARAHRLPAVSCVEAPRHLRRITVPATPARRSNDIQTEQFMALLRRALQKQGFR